jgi:glycosyltransferase involved in cell wall biosynthesis
MKDLLVSVITVCRNSAGTIKDTIRSVLDQSYRNIEYIVIDGSSTDGTIDIIKSFGSRISKFVSESDNGMYDAINKGIKISSGEIVGIVNSDDFFYDNKVIELVAESFKEPELEAVFGDAVFVNPLNTKKKVRYYSSRNFNPGRFRFGYMPAHPSFYVRRVLFESLGYYKVNYTIAADFELLARFLYVNKIKYKYLAIPFVTMRMGGISNKNVFSNLTLNKEIARACMENEIKTNILNIYLKYFTKFFEFFVKKTPDN